MGPPGWTLVRLVGHGSAWLNIGLPGWIFVCLIGHVSAWLEMCRSGWKCVQPSDHISAQAGHVCLYGINLCQSLVRWT